MQQQKFIYNKLYMCDSANFDDLVNNFPHGNFSFSANLNVCPKDTSVSSCNSWYCDGLVSKNTCAGNFQCTSYECKKN